MSTEQHLPRPNAQAAHRLSGESGDKQTRYRQSLIRLHLCPHCGKECAPYFECEERRLKKRISHLKKKRENETGINNLSVKGLLSMSKTILQEDDDSPAVKTGVVMLAAFFYEFELRTIGTITQYPFDFIASILINLKLNRIYQFGTWYIDWDDPEGGDLSFILDNLAAQGMLKRAE